MVEGGWLGGREGPTGCVLAGAASTAAHQEAGAAQSSPVPRPTTTEAAAQAVGSQDGMTNKQGERWMGQQLTGRW